MLNCADLEELHKTYGNEKKYIVDPSIPGVGKYLRMIGIDVANEASFTDEYILFLSRSQGRAIITRSNKLMTKIKEQMQRNAKITKQIAYHEALLLEKTSEEERQDMQDIIDSLKEDIINYDYYYVNSIGRHAQVTEVAHHYRIKYIPERMYSLCNKCGMLVKVVERESIKNEIHENTYNDNTHFSKCTNAACGQIFWGIHHQNVKQDKWVQLAISFCKAVSYTDGADSLPQNEDATTVGDDTVLD